MIEQIVNGFEETAAAALRILTDTAAEKDPFRIGLSGGRSIRPVLEAVGRLSDEILSRSIFYLVDERIGSDLNQQMLSDTLFTGLLREGRISADQLVFPPTDLSPLETAEAYSDVFVPPDAVFFGVGEDGHIASLFPGSPLLNSTGRILPVFDSPKPPPERITVTLESIPHDGMVVLLFLGEQKEKALKKFKSTDDYTVCPAAFFKTFPNVRIITDRRLLT